jgi:archaellum biogenesis ATPase FlaH
MLQISTLLNTTRKSGNYFIINGEHGVGKSTLLKEACKIYRSGVIYVSVDFDVKTFGRKFGHAVGFNFDEDVTPLVLLYKTIGVTNRLELKIDEPIGSFFRMAPFLINAARAYKENNGRTPVVIIDNVNRLSDDNLLDLQRFAKDCADQKALVVIFVTSETNVLRVLQSVGEWSRKAGVLEIRDIDDEHAIEYLIKEGCVSPEEARLIVTNITGGRFSLLRVAKSTYEETKTLIFRDIRRVFKEAGLLDDHHHPAWQVIHAILGSPTRSITDEQFEDFISRDIEQKIFKFKIFSGHADGTVSMNSRATESFAREYMAGHKGTNVQTVNK